MYDCDRAWFCYYHKELFGLATPVVQAVLHHAALKTEPVAVDRQGSIELFYSTAVLQSTCKQSNSWVRVPTKLHQYHHAGIHIKLVVPNFNTLESNLSMKTETESQWVREKVILQGLNVWLHFTSQNLMHATLTPQYF